jgi:hypothetical protein
MEKSRLRYGESRIKKRKRGKDVIEVQKERGKECRRVPGRAVPKWNGGRREDSSKLFVQGVYPTIFRKGLKIQNLFMQE